MTQGPLDQESASTRSERLENKVSQPNEKPEQENMKISMCTRGCGVAIAVATLVGFLPSPAHGQLEIKSLTRDGKLSWADPGGTGTHYAVQWSTSGLTNWSSWQDAQSRLSGLGPVGTVEVPMFYRMVTPDPTYKSTASYSYFQTLEEFNPLTPLETNEMRITFMGSMIPLPVRRAQAEMSVFVEVGWKADTNDLVYKGRAVDQFVFDCGAGVSANYAAAVVGFRRMDKVFINHLHGDHMSDLAHIYCFGPAGDRKSPLYVFGQSPSGLATPGSGIIYDDGVSNFCATARSAWRWHSESFSFQPTAYTNYTIPTKDSWGLPHEPLPVGDDPPDDGFALVPITLDWRAIGGVAYDNKATGVKVTHYPVIHCRQGSMGYKVSWTPPGASKPLTVIYSSDTKPETNSVNEAINNRDGVDVFIHEMVVPPEVWAYKNMGLNAPPDTNSPLYASFQATVEQLMDVQDSSHTPQGAFGYLLSTIEPKPRLTVATHFPVADDTVASALQSVSNHCPGIKMGKDLVWSFDLMVLRVFPDRIEQRRAVVSDYAFNPPVQLNGGTKPPKYSNAYLQIDMSTSLSRTNEDGSVNWNENGY
jgi:ribonuclease Z